MNILTVGSVSFGCVVGWTIRLILRGSTSRFRLVSLSVAILGTTGVSAFFSWTVLPGALAGFALGLYVHRYLIAILQAKCSTPPTDE